MKLYGHEVASITKIELNSSNPQRICEVLAALPGSSRIATDRCMVSGIEVVVGIAEEGFQGITTINFGTCDLPSGRMMHGPGGLRHSLSPQGQAQERIIAGEACVDHFAIVVPEGEVKRWTRYYCEMLGFSIRSHGMIEGAEGKMEFAMLSSPNQMFRLALAAPLPDEECVQLRELLVRKEDGCVQHIAIEVQDIVSTVNSLEKMGLNVIKAVPGYFKSRRRDQRISSSLFARAESVGACICDVDSGALLQIFTEELVAGEGWFMELFEKHGVESLVPCNAVDLFDSLEVSKKISRGVSRVPSDG
jgi:4-hydroxyphenylpyruvate dioxygenase